MSPRRCRIVLYSHDTMGLGHMRRTMLVAQALVASEQHPSVLLIAGAREANNFALPPGVDCLSLPAMHKDTDAHYHARHLDLSLREIVALRARAIRGAIEAFEPNVFIADNVPRGAQGELDSSLALLRARGGVRCVLGMRDILDEPGRVRAQWRHAANEACIRSHYGSIWVYGDMRVCDVAQAYAFPPDIAAKVRYVGYLDQRARLQRAPSNGHDTLASLHLPPGRNVLCLVGGGQDGAMVAEAFVSAPFAPDVNAIVITGPMMPVEQRHRLLARAAERPRLRVLQFVENPTALLATVDLVIAMGGYNTVTEILSFGKPALIVPRIRPRLEQFIRAERLRDLGLLEVLHPDALTPTALADWVATCPGTPPRAHEVLDLRALDRLGGLLTELCDKPVISRYPKIDIERDAARAAL
jgi:predicted glycosyltransferase